MHISEIAGNDKKLLLIVPFSIMKINVTQSPQLPEYHHDAATTKDNFALNLSYLNPRGPREEDPRKSSFKE